ncbi:transposase, partial [Oleiphilus sp. HI0132]
MNTRKKYSQEFKLDAISLVLDQGHTRTEAAR